jgi:hypothetical protein
MGSQQSKGQTNTQKTKFVVWPDFVVDTTSSPALWRQNQFSCFDGWPDDLPALVRRSTFNYKLSLDVALFASSRSWVSLYGVQVGQSDAELSTTCTFATEPVVIKNGG